MAGELPTTGEVKNQPTYVPKHDFRHDNGIDPVTKEQVLVKREPVGIAAAKTIIALYPQTGNYTLMESAEEVIKQSNAPAYVKQMRAFEALVADDDQTALAATEFAARYVLPEDQTPQASVARFAVAAALTDTIQKRGLKDILDEKRGKAFMQATQEAIDAFPARTTVEVLEETDKLDAKGEPIAVKKEYHPGANFAGTRVLAALILHDLNHPDLIPALPTPGDLAAKVGVKAKELAVAAKNGVSRRWASRS